jgi:hypothetical protein
MTRLLLAFVFSLFSFTAYAAEGSWSYKFKSVSETGKHLRYSASVEVGYAWYTVYPRKDSNTLAVRFGYWEPGQTPPSQFKITLGAANGETLTFSGELNTDNLYVSSVSGSSTITIYIKKEHLDFHRKATSLKVALSDKVLNFPMSNSRVAINRAQSAADNPTSGAVGLDGLIETCNKLVTHPWDNNRKKTGVEWKDIQAKPAIEACRAAYNLDKSNMRMAYQLGRAYDKAGNEKALGFLKHAADNGYSPAAYHFSLLMDNGVYVAKDHTKYLRYLKDSALNEYIPAKSAYGEYLIKQSPENPEAIQRGKVLLETAVDNNYNPARFFLAMKWFDGTFGQKNNKRGFDYLTTASYLGHAKSSYFIATMYRDGNGLPQNPAKYLEYLKEAANQGHAKAKKLLAQ